MNADDVALLSTILDGLLAEADRLESHADAGDKHWSTSVAALVSGAQATGILTAVTAIRCALPQLAKETV